MITWAGNWKRHEQQAAMDTLGSVSLMLGVMANIPSNETFDRLFGDVVLEAVPSVSGDIHGHVSALYPRHIKLEIGQITPALVVHELGHVLILTDPNDPNIADWLSCNVIKTASGRAVTGAGRNKYSRHMGYRASRFTGYISINYPAIQHPYYMGEDGKTPSEDFCGIWESWVKGNLADNEAGQALRQWIENYLLSRLDNTSRSVGAGGSVYPFGGRETETR